MGLLIKSQADKKSWDNYWNSRSINRDIMQVWAAYFVHSYEKQFGYNKSDVILDFGAGIGNVSYFLKDKARLIYLYDKSDFMLDILRQNFEKFEQCAVLKSIKQIDQKVDLIIVNSVLQYMTHGELDHMLDDLQVICNAQTKIVFSDIIPKNYSKLTDFVGQLKLGLKYGFFLKLMQYAISNTFFSLSMSLSSSYLTTYEEDEIMSILSRHHFTSERMENNFTPSKKRYTVVCRLNYC